MRRCESTTTITQNDACMLQRYVHQEVIRMCNRWMMCFLAVLGVSCCYAAFSESLHAGLECTAIFACMAAIWYGISVACSKRIVAQMHPLGAHTWTYTTWFDDDGLHRLDEDGDEYVYRLRKLRFAYRDGSTVLLSTINQAVIPVNLLYMSETDRKSVLKLLKTDCPKLVVLE